ncbi:MAG: Asp-tRNA(Asn)/Glu-tRNA(Gln) amidotransferase subunit GatA [Defluviitaleaceae bacterium]|nr:Asp-tRNA(Asn)/Glu-tRNA(Gln) amidotransferase subunit GatA [Defluviitaleaceae bacterium]
MSELIKKSITELSELIHNKSIKPSEVCSAFLSQYDKAEVDINAFITMNKDEIAQTAHGMDNLPINADTPPLFGIPVAVKDNICTKGLRTTAATKMLENFIPPYDATVVERLRGAGAIIFGKTDMDECAMGSTTASSYFARSGAKGAVKNPNKHDEDSSYSRVPGGSSGGSAAAVAAFMAPVSLGSDTGGSIRLPAHYCGVVGYKPSYGAVSRYGLIGYGSSFDCIGPLARTVCDVVKITSIISGRDKKDSTSNPQPMDFSNNNNFSVKGKKIGIIRECFEKDKMAPPVIRAVEYAAKAYADMGAEVEFISLPRINDALPVYYILALAEASSNLARLDGIRYGFRSQNVAADDLYTATRTLGFGDVVKRRIWLGTYVLGAERNEEYYQRAITARAAIFAQFQEVFKVYDALLTPVSVSQALKHDEKLSDYENSLIDKCTVPVNLAGLPAISMPAVVENGLPAGFQLIAGRFEDAKLLSLAKAFENYAGVLEQ